MLHDDICIMLICYNYIGQCFSTSGLRPHLGSPSDFRGVARLSNCLKNDIRTEKCWPNSPPYSTDVGVLRGWGRAQITVDILGREAKKVEKHTRYIHVSYIDLVIPGFSHP